MRFLPLVLLSAAAAAQSPLVAPFNSNNGQSGNQFDLVAINPVIVTGFDINIDAGVWDIEVYTVTGGGTKVGIENTAAAWTLQGSATGVTGAGLNLATPLPIALAVPIGPGATMGFYVTVTNGTSMNYTNGVTPQAVLAANADLQILEGTGHSYPFGSLFNPRNFNANIYYSVGSGTAALNGINGAGCGGSSIGDGTAYELFDGPISGFDLSNTSMTYAWTGDGYAVLQPAANTIVPAVGGALVLGDDQIVSVPLPFSFPCPGGNVDEVFLCSNGFLGFQAGLPADFSESVAEFLSQQSRFAFLWDDFNPTVGGTINAEAVGGEFHITFTGISQFGTTDLNDVQVVLSPNGDIDVRYGTIASLDSIVGITSGNGATDPGSIDLTDPVALPVVITTGQEFAALALSGATRPVLGTSWDLDVSNIPPSATFGVNIFGTTDPAILDLVALGMPGCQLRTDLAIVQGPWLLGGPTSFSYSFPVPATPVTLIGFVLYTQAAVWVPGVNQFGAITTNGVGGTLGDV